jgi:type II pantothenate kinase
MKYLGGTGVGGGTLVGLSKLLIGAADIGHISEFAGQGELGNVDLRIKDMTASGTMPVMNADMTAANFGNVSDVATKSDIAKGITNLVYETVGMVAIFASRSVGVTDIVLTGNLTRLPSCLEKFEEFNRLGYGVRFVVPELSEFSTAIGCAISALD